MNEDERAGVDQPPNRIRQESVVDFAVMATLPIELRAILDQLTDIEHVAMHGSCYYLGNLTDANGNTLKAVVAEQAGPSVNAAAAASSLLGHWRPPYLFSVGLAAAVAPSVQALGDVIVGTTMQCYGVDKATGQPSWRMSRSIDADSYLLQKALIFQASAPAWQRRIPRTLWSAQEPSFTPSVHFGTIVAVELVQTRQLSQWFAEQRSRHYAVDMEGAGIASVAAGSVHATRTLAVRGLCDYGDAHKDDSWQAYAAHAAAAWLASFAASGLLSLAVRKER
jgi:nucleoside phosphorylase